MSSSSLGARPFLELVRRVSPCRYPTKPVVDLPTPAGISPPLPRAAFALVVPLEAWAPRSAFLRPAFEGVDAVGGAALRWVHSWEEVQALSSVVLHVGLPVPTS